MQAQMGYPSQVAHLLLVGGRLGSVVFCLIIYGTRRDM
jgi:hypothetical protein